MRADDLMKEIHKSCDVEEADVRRTESFMWFDRQEEYEATITEEIDGKKVTRTMPAARSVRMVISVGQPLPFNEGMVCVAIFKHARRAGLDETSPFLYKPEWRVYAMARTLDSKLPPSCYTFSKTAPTFDADKMSLELFKAEIAEELLDLDAQTASLYDEEEPEPEPANVASTLPAPPSSPQSTP